jgi:hypothetical protein
MRIYTVTTISLLTACLGFTGCGTPPGGHPPIRRTRGPSTTARALARRQLALYVERGVKPGRIDSITRIVKLPQRAGSQSQNSAARSNSLTAGRRNVELCREPDHCP